jgi:hypothetical protein
VEHGVGEGEEEGWVTEHEYGHDDEKVPLGAACQQIYLAGGGRERERCVAV